MDGRRWAAAAAAVIAAGAVVTAALAASTAGKTYYFIPKDTLNPYEVIADHGGKLALDSLGDTATAVRNNGGGHYNHSLFWESMSPDGGGEPDGDLADAISSAFGSFSDFQAKVKETGVNQFGSGWSWLVHDGSGLAVVGSANQDSPISKGQTPLLGVDVWEHAYYLKYQNKRPDYIDAWWNVVNWAKVAERLGAAS